MQHRPLESALADVVVQGRSGLSQKRRQRFLVPQQVGDGFAQPEFGSVFGSANCASSQACNLSITGRLRS
jgi:hypothetical protein